MTICEVKNICKSFPGVKALADVSIAFEKGEVHAIVGENGAGKSTLMKILGGLFSLDSGTVLINDREVAIRSISDALRHGISRCLDLFEPALHSSLKKAGFLTRDPRIVERKKPGRSKARKRFQFSKR